MCYIKAPNIQIAHKKILDRILHSEKYPNENIEVIDVFDQEGNKTKEVHNILVTIENPLDEKHSICPNITEEELKLYAECYLDINKAKEYGFVPGQRLFDFFGLNQYEKIVKLLKSHENTRRASIITCNPLIDWDNERPPCLLLIDLKIRNGKLHLTGVLRSNDMYRTWPANAYALAQLLKKFSKDVGVEPGHLDILSISAHIYEEDLEKAEKSLKEH